MSQTPPPADAASARFGRRVMWAFVLFNWLMLFLLAVGFGLYQSHLYRDGTPATATIDHCYNNRGRHCTATWNVDGARHHGKINGDFDNDKNVGSSLDVRVRGNDAYTASMASWHNTGFILTGLLGVAFVVIVVLMVSRR